MKQHLIQTDGLRQQVLEQGEGPLVILCHGFLELSWSWRAQWPALAKAGFRAVAPDMRGYGGTERPAAQDAYVMSSLVADMVDLVRALGETQAVIVGHDWGAPVAWHSALLRSDVFRAVAGLSVPFHPRRPGKSPLTTWREVGAASSLGDYYVVRFQDAGAEAEFEADVEMALRKTFWSLSGTTAAEQRTSGFLTRDQGFLDAIPTPDALPLWLSEEELARYVKAYTASGFGSALNWYRNIDRNWQTLAWTQDRTIDVPALFMVGERDMVRNVSGRAEAAMKRWIPGMRDPIVVPEAGHWLQQERPEAVNQALISFLRGL
jgi:pimeloyl-ACP methyl ester carboxylesterase